MATLAGQAIIFWPLSPPNPNPMYMTASVQYSLVSTVQCRSSLMPMPQTRHGRRSPPRHQDHKVISSWSCMALQTRCTTSAQPSSTTPPRNAISQPEANKLAFERMSPSFRRVSFTSPFHVSNEVVHHLTTIDDMAQNIRTMIPFQVLQDIDNARNPMQLTKERLERAATENQFMNGKIAAIDVSCLVEFPRVPYH